MVMLPEAAWQEVASTLGEIKDLMKQEARKEKSEWIESTEARKILGVSPKTWQTYRDRRLLPFAQFGRKILVKKSDLESFIAGHIISNN